MSNCDSKRSTAYAKDFLRRYFPEQLMDSEDREIYNKKLISEEGFKLFGENNEFDENGKFNWDKNS